MNLRAARCRPETGISSRGGPHAGKNSERGAHQEGGNAARLRQEFHFCGRI